MGKIYCMSDIHGFYDIFQRRLDQLGELGDGDALILLGDYIDDGPESGQVLWRIYELQQAWGDRCVVLPGNHEKMFLEWLDTYAVPGMDLSGECGLLTYDDWLEDGLQTLRSLITEQQWTHFQQVAPTLSRDSLNIIAAKMVMETNRDLIRWLRRLPYYHETERQIFVHAGIDEGSGDLWRYGTPENVFLGQHPAPIGTFYKDIIAGHNGTGKIMGDLDFHDVLWDGKSHYFCDGTVVKSGRIPVLVYDTDTGKYYSLGDDGLHPVPKCPEEQLEKLRANQDEDWFWSAL